MPRVGAGEVQDLQEQACTAYVCLRSSPASQTQPCGLEQVEAAQARVTDLRDTGPSILEGFFCARLDQAAQPLLAESMPAPAPSPAGPHIATALQPTLPSIEQKAQTAAQQIAGLR